MFTDGCSNRILVDLFFYRVSSSCYRVCFSGEPYRCLQPTFGGRSRSQQMKGREMESHVKRVGTSVSSFSRLKKTKNQQQLGQANFESAPADRRRTDTRVTRKLGQTTRHIDDGGQRSLPAGNRPKPTKTKDISRAIQNSNKMVAMRPQGRSLATAEGWGGVRQSSRR